MQIRNNLKIMIETFLFCSCILVSGYRGDPANIFQANFPTLLLANVLVRTNAVSEKDDKNIFVSQMYSGIVIRRRSSSSRKETNLTFTRRGTLTFWRFITPARLTSDNISVSGLTKMEDAINRLA